MTVPTPPSIPVTRVELFRRAPVGGTANLTPKCPSECDPDCDVACHEGHHSRGDRQHDVVTCEAGIGALAQQAAEVMQASQEAWREEHGYWQNSGEYLHRLGGALVAAGWSAPAGGSVEVQTKTREDVVQAAKAALAEAFTDDIGYKNPDWDIDKPDGPDNEYHLKVPMSERMERDLMVTFTDTDGMTSIRSVMIPEVVEVLAAAGLLASTAPPAPQPEATSNRSEIWQTSTATFWRDAVTGQVFDLQPDEEYPSLPADATRLVNADLRPLRRILAGKDSTDE